MPTVPWGKWPSDSVNLNYLEVQSFCSSIPTSPKWIISCMHAAFCLAISRACNWDCWKTQLPSWIQRYWDGMMSCIAHDFWCYKHLYAQLNYCLSWFTSLAAYRAIRLPSSKQIMWIQTRDRKSVLSYNRVPRTPWTPTCKYANCLYSASQLMTSALSPLLVHLIS
jgi:hypothetical protein